MATICGAERSSERTAMERFGSGGMALLPWTKQMLTVLWEQLRLLVQVIYYTFMSVFQMFRLEVHVRITDETGQHIQHMNAAASQTDSFLFSSLFDGENGVIVGGSNPLSNFCSDGGETFAGKSTAEALLSSLRADDICCGLVDDFVSRTTGKDDIFHQSSWKVGDWNIFLSSSDSSNDGCRKSREKIFKQEFAKEKVLKQDTSEEDRSFHWSSEEDQNVVEFDSEEGRALWESLSRSSDPYNPFFFSACISTNTNMGKSQGEVKDRAADGVSVSQATEEILGPRALNIWVSRSDSESSWSSWASSESSSPDFDKEENERLLDFFSCPDDPYNPLSFTACTVTSTSSKTTNTSTTSKPSPPPPQPTSDTDTEKTSSFPPSSEEDDEEQLLWKSLCQTDDPYHPLNFQACLQSLPTSLRDPPSDTQKPPTTGRKCEKEARTPKKSKFAERKIRHHSNPAQSFIPWKRPGQKPSSAPEEKEGAQASAAPKKVRFSPLVQVHVMHTWQFARQASRKGPWEEMARDRDRFCRRIDETERAIGHCFTLPHRERMRAYVDGAFK